MTFFATNFYLLLVTLLLSRAVIVLQKRLWSDFSLNSAFDLVGPKTKILRFAPKTVSSNNLFQVHETRYFTKLLEKIQFI